MDITSLDLARLDLRVQELEQPTGTVFHLIDIGSRAKEDRARPVASLWATPERVDSIRALAHVLANAPDMLRAGHYGLTEKRYADPALFGALKFREVSAEEFEAQVGPIKANVSSDLEEHIAEVELPEELATEFPATYTHGEHTQQGFGTEGTAEVSDGTE